MSCVTNGKSVCWRFRGQLTHTRIYRYHGKCLKIARGKIKEDDKYTCPICDYRVKIPRDAARPRLEDLQDWQAEIPQLPFQPEEDLVLDQIITTGQDFRDFIRPYTNPIVSTPEEVTTQRFYLRKIEGADILLAFETNFFRQELHKWAPVAPDPPPNLEYSLSTRKPRPTKQQKLMAQLGIDNPDDLPQQFRTKQHTFNKTRKPSDAHTKPPLPLQPAPQFVKSDDLANGNLSITGPPPNHAYRPPPATTSHLDPNYEKMFTTSNASPTFPWPNNIPNPSASPDVPNSPVFRPMTPPNGTGGPNEAIFSPSTSSFAAAALRDTVGANVMVSPMREAYGHAHSNSGGNMDNLFGEFTTEGADDVVASNEAGEALEGMGAAVAGEDEAAQKLADEFLERD